MRGAKHGVLKGKKQDPQVRGSQKGKAMTLQAISHFLQRGKTYFPGAEPPVAFFYSDDEAYSELVIDRKGFICLVAQLAAVREGNRRAFTADSIGCAGGRRYCGFPTEPNPDLKHFLSTGVPGRVEGLRLKARPDLVVESDTGIPAARRKYLVACRIDRLKEGEQPQVVAWFSRPDALSALFHLVGYSSSDRYSVISPQGAGCGSVIGFPMAEGMRERPRGVLGMFDLSARPYVDPCELTFSVPWSLFVRMAGDMEGSFLGGKAWRGLKNRRDR